jgi:hypothetical protein
MYKKAGIIIGVLMLGVALVIHFLFSTEGGKEKASRPATQPQPQVSASADTSVTKPPQTQPVQPTQPAPQSPSSVPSSQTNLISPPTEGYRSEEGTLSKRIFSEYTEEEFANALGTPVTTNKEIMTVSAKKVILFDSDAVSGSKAGKQLTYGLTLLGDDPNFRLTAYVNKEAYDSVEVGDRLTVEYEIYANSNNVKLPLIKSIKK